MLAWHCVIVRISLLESTCVNILFLLWNIGLYSVSLSPGSDVARLFAKRSSKSYAPIKCVHALIQAASACLSHCQEMLTKEYS